MNTLLTLFWLYSLNGRRGQRNLYLKIGEVSRKTHFLNLLLKKTLASRTLELLMVNTCKIQAKI